MKKSIFWGSNRRCRIGIISFVLVCTLFHVGCATHSAYDTSRFRYREIEYDKVSLDKDGLSKEQIEIILSTKPPSKYPIDIAIIILKDRYIDAKVEDYFLYALIGEIKKLKSIDRITLIPEFLMTDKVDFNAIQELGIRSLSEYVVIININSKNLFKWSKILESKYEISSSIEFIIVDSYTSGMLTSDKLYSSQEYKKNLLKHEEKEKAQEIIFKEQAFLMSIKLKELFK